jgi:hypothetical protein
MDNKAQLRRLNQHCKGYPTVESATVSDGLGSVTLAQPVEF